MNAKQHLDKARGILAGLAKLDPATEALAIIDGTMIAGYHLGNASLHAHGVTAESVHFNTPSKFEVPAETLPEAVKPVYDVFAELEEMRSHYVRSPNQPDPGAGTKAMAHLVRMASLCGAAIT
jgi:hypothetical protein